MSLTNEIPEGMRLTPHAHETTVPVPVPPPVAPVSATPRTDAHIKQFGPYIAGIYVGSTVHPDFARTLDRELTSANEQIENLEARGIHTCHDNCQRPLCVAGREKRKLEAELTTLRATLAKRDEELEIQVERTSLARSERDEWYAQLTSLQAAARRVCEAWRGMAGETETTKAIDELSALLPSTGTK